MPGIFQVISTHAPRTGSDTSLKGIEGSEYISTHAPRTGSDRIFPVFNMGGGKNFNPRSPHGERPAGEIVEWGSADISTHAPRTGSDDKLAQ